MTAKILIVDDVPTSAALMAARMEAEYFETATAGDGIEALRAASAWRPDLVLLDVMMPGMDGFEACRRLKAGAETADIPVVMVTALDGVADRLRGLEAGADEFLTRPVDPEALVARLKGLLRLKRLADEWRARAQAMRALGVGAAVPDEPSSEGARALVVADWEPGSAAVREALALEGVVAATAAGGDAALRACAEAAFDLVVIDTALLRDDPLRLVARLRAGEATREVPILAVADPGTPGMIARAFDLGANDWVTRPVDPNELRIRARHQIRRRVYQRRLREDLDGALAMAVADPLTGLPNRRYLLNYLGQLAAGGRSARVAALYVDLDHFKLVNDRFGHDAGDAALRLVAGVLRREFRAADLAVRYGGEEFVAVLPEANGAEAAAAAERVRAAVAGLAFAPGEAGLPCPLTVSVGVAVAEPGWASGEALLRRADRALYVAKAGGRNRVETDPDGAAPAR